MRPGRGDITTTRVDRNTASGIEWVTKTTVVAGLAADPQQLGLHVLAGHLVERAERLVHQQQRRVRGEGSGDRHPLLHAAGELPREVLGELGQLDQLEHLERPRSPPGPVPALQLERQLDVLDDAAPLEQARLLERHPVVLIEPRVPRRLAVHEDLRRSWVRSGWRSAAAASTCRTPTVRSARRTLPARSPGRCRRGPRPRSAVPALNTFDSPRTSTAFEPFGRGVGHPVASRRTVPHRHEIDQRDEPGHQQARGRPRRTPP